MGVCLNPPTPKVTWRLEVFHHVVGRGGGTRRQCLSTHSLFFKRPFGSMMTTRAERLRWKHGCFGVWSCSFLNESCPGSLRTSLCKVVDSGG